MNRHVLLNFKAYLNTADKRINRKTFYLLIILSAQWRILYYFYDSFCEAVIGEIHINMPSSLLLRVFCEAVIGEMHINMPPLLLFRVFCEAVIGEMHINMPPLLLLRVFCEAVIGEMHINMPPLLLLRVFSNRKKNIVFKYLDLNEILSKNFFLQNVFEELKKKVS